MFKFAFSSESNPEESKNVYNTTTEQVKCEEVAPDRETIDFIKDVSKDKIVSRSYGVIGLQYFKSQSIIEKLESFKNCNSHFVLDAERVNSDLITGVYEGGLKIWECTHDLCSFIVSTNVFLNGKKILDLGCGGGLIGILCHLQGAISYFQDYNADVINHFTIPNFAINVKDTNFDADSDCKFYAGDWESFVEVLKYENDESKFDFIFTAETIYNIENYEKLHKVFEQCLKKDGRIYLAAKYYYFGVGGGISHFKETLDKKGIFTCNTCWKHSEGVKREILEIRFR